ncbi:pyruvate kinase [Tranquillimonas rosea]|uniref:Pyruvate kinase n=2 Tax=Tranquillimonas rosea TaxID=641238 RepID=A0A1H9VL86_9RHOB|nr:pyruvate kinase [Tranquillimonas rosea]
MLRTLFHAGVDTFRLNFSHGAHSDHAAVIRSIRALEREEDVPIGILQDLQGPKIRLGRLPSGPRQLENREKISLVLGETTSDHTQLPLPHAEIFASVRAGDRIFVDDGRIRLRVTERGLESLEVEVLSGGTVSDRKGVNLPDTKLDLPVMTDKDREDLKFGLECGVDWVALSFVQTAEDLSDIKALLEGRAGVIAKIEKPSAVADIQNIARSADAIMIARGDLGVEIPAENVPSTQKEIIEICRRANRPVIVATQMLESMTTSPTPTRAEASDVATAVYDGADAVMLSAESATGAYPAEAVEVMDRILARTEGHVDYVKRSDRPRATEHPEDCIARSAARLADELSAPAIVTYSMSGATALRVSAKRPSQPLLAITPDMAIARRLALAWGTRALLEKNVVDYETMVHFARESCQPFVPSGRDDRLVVVAGFPFGRSGSTNNIRIVRAFPKAAGSA